MCVHWTQGAEWIVFRHHMEFKYVYCHSLYRRVHSYSLERNNKLLTTEVTFGFKFVSCANRLVFVSLTI